MLDKTSHVAETSSPLFALGDDQVAVRDMARAFADDKLSPHAVRWDEEKYFPVDVMREAASLGMGGVYVREDVGGSGLSRLDAALIFEALATGCPAVSAYISIHNMSAWMIDAFGSDEQRRHFLPSLATMERLASYCLTEPGAGSDAAALRTRASRDGEGYLLTGQKQFISGRARATFTWSWLARAEREPAVSRPSSCPATALASSSARTNERWVGMRSPPER